MRFTLRRFIVLLLMSTTFSLHGAATEGRRHIALVFDDGPVPEMAPKFLALFAAEDVHVTFAHVGRTVEQHPATTRAMAAAGHEVANHSYSHLHPKDLDDAALEHEMLGAQCALSAALDNPPRWYWPPFLARDPRMAALAEKAGIGVYEPENLVSSEDWNREVGAEEIKRRGTTGITDGTVILFHEWRAETLEQMPAILAELKRQNCVFLTFSELAAYVGTRNHASADSNH